jgi:hypothetical protein
VILVAGGTGRLDEGVTWRRSTFRRGPRVPGSDDIPRREGTTVIGPRGKATASLAAAVLLVGAAACEDGTDDPEVAAERLDERDDIEGEVDDEVEERLAEEGTAEIEYQLAVVHEQGYVSPDDPLVEQYRSALDAVEPKCEEDRRMVADMVVRSAQLAAERGIANDPTPLEMIRSIDGAVEPELAPMACSEVLAAILGIMQGDEG